MTAQAQQKRLLKWLMGSLLWTLIGLSFASQLYVSSLKTGQPMSWGAAIGWSLGDWYVWGLLSIPVLSLVRRFHLEGPRWGGSLAIHLCASAVASLVYIFVRALIGQWQTRSHGTTATFVETFSPLLVKTFFFNVLIYWGIVCAGHALDYYRQFRERELRAMDLEKSLAEARLKSLQMQLNPHFLFNTLHAISALMHKDVDAADRMVAQLSDLLRRALDSGDEQEVSLRREIDFLERYVAIEKTRFGKRLAVEMRIAPETREALVPNLLLQPLVENAIRHGIEPQARPGKIDIAAARVGEELIIEVRDNGGGLPAKWNENIGLSNTRSRLSQLYDASHRFELRNSDSGGLTITIAIPFRLAGGARSMVAQAT